MSNGSRLSRGDRRRNDRLARLRAVVTRQTAVPAFDLAADKQVCALTDQDSRVLDQIAERAGVWLACVLPLLEQRARESEDVTHNKNDETDARIIARLVPELRCYLARARRTGLGSRYALATAPAWVLPARWWVGRETLDVREAFRARSSMASRLASTTGPKAMAGGMVPVVSKQVHLGHVNQELAAALEELARLAWRGVPGCDGASVSVLYEDSVSTWAATQPRITEIDKAQYRNVDGPCVTAIRDRQVVSVEDYRGEQRWPGVAAKAVAEGIRSSLSLPLVAGDGRAMGGLNMYGEMPAAFDDASRQSAEIFARQATIMLTQLQLLHNERAARAREYELAATLQRSLLPTLPTLPGITSAARYLVSAEQAQVGGDWYDLFALPDGAIGIAIGDVMGHDVSAAAAMGQLRSVLRSYAYEGSSPSVVLDRLDRLVQGFEMAQVATAIFGRLVRDDAGVTLLFANAGHLPPVLRHRDGSVHRIERGASPLIGVLRPGERPRNEAALTLPEGSLLLLYTDGLVETREREYDAGINDLCAALAALDPQADPDQACETLLAALVGDHQEDDIALLAVRIDPLPTPT